MLSLRKISCISFTLICLVLPGFAYAQLQGAEKILQKLTQSISDSGTSNTADPAKILEKDLADFVKKNKDLAPDAAAAQWVSFVDRFWSLPREQRLTDFSPYAYKMAQIQKPGQTVIAFGKIMAALPPPASWPAIEQSTEKHKAKDKADESRLMALRLIAYFLNGHYEKIEKEMAAAKKSNKGMTPYQKERALTTIRQIELSPELQKGNASDIAGRFEQMLAFQEKTQFGGIIKIPDLVSLAGEQKAETLIRKTILLPNVQLFVPSGGPTLKITQRLVFDLLPKIKQPQWGLIASPDDVALYEAMRKRFPIRSKEEGPGEGDSSAQSQLYAAMLERDYNSENTNRISRYGNVNVDKASVFYVLGLLNKNRSAEATSLTLVLAKNGSLESQFREVWNKVDQVAETPILFPFFSKLLREKPDLSLWDYYISMSIAMGKQDEMLQTAKMDAASTATVSLIERLTLHGHLVEAYIATDQIDPAITLLKKLAVTPADKEPQSIKKEVAEKRAEFALQLADIGKTLKQPKLSEEALSLAMAAMEDADRNTNSGERLRFLNVYRRQTLHPYDQSGKRQVPNRNVSRSANRKIHKENG